MMNWTLKINQIDMCLKNLSVTRGDASTLPVDDAFATWIDMAIRIREQRSTIFLIGNGASASMASHVAADLAKNGHVHTEVFSDLSLITAIANQQFRAISQRSEGGRRGEKTGWCSGYAFGHEEREFANLKRRPQFLRVRLDIRLGGNVPCSHPSSLDRQNCRKEFIENL
jgi:hypothetical protein